MIRSMTAFAAGERNTEAGVIGCELRAVNHRFLEIGVRLPEELRVLEPALRERIAARVSRGKLDLTLRLRPSDASENLQLNQALVAQLSAIAQDLDGRFPQLRTDFGQLLQLPGVLQSRSADPETRTAATRRTSQSWVAWLRRTTVRRPGSPRRAVCKPRA